MSSYDRTPGAISPSNDSGTATGQHTPTSEQSDRQPTFSLLPLESSISPNEDLTLTEPSTRVEVDADDDERTDSTPHQQETIYDAEGDIELIVGPSQTHKFQLSSKLLASISVIWKDLIDSAKETDSRTVYLPDDDPVSVSVLLQIIHLRFAVLPRSFTFRELYSIARVSQKYQVYELFQPFVLKWTEPFIREELDPEQTEWILISWEFRIEYIFERWLDHLSRTAEKDEDGCIMYKDHKLAELLPDFPPGEYAKLVEDTRESLLSDLVEVCKKGLEQSCCYYRDESPYEEQCNILMAGYLLTGLRSLGGWPLDPLTIRISAEEFKSNLLGLHFDSLPVKFSMNDSSDLEDHSECGLCALRHGIAAVSPTMQICWPRELFDCNNCDVEASTSPILRRWGFHRRDFERIDSDSEGDGDYDDPTDSDSEPDEEFAEDDFEEESNEGGEEGIVDSALDS